MSGHPQVHRVPVDAEHLAAGRQRDQVAADAACQVGETAGRPPIEAAGPVPGGRFRRGLLQPGPGEQHPPGPAELRGRGAAKLVLGGRGGHQPGRVVPAQPGRQRQRGLPGGTRGGHPGQQFLALRRQEGRHLGEPVCHGSGAGGTAGPGAGGVTGPVRHGLGTTTNCRRYRSRKVTGPRGPGTLSMLMPVSGTASSLKPSSSRGVAFQKAPVPA